MHVGKLKAVGSSPTRNPNLNLSLLLLTLAWRLSMPAAVLLDVMLAILGAATHCDVFGPTCGADDRAASPLRVLVSALGHDSESQSEPQPDRAAALQGSTAKITHSSIYE